MDVKSLVYEYLNRQEIPYEKIAHEARDSMQACAKIIDVWQVPMIKNLFLSNTQETSFYLLLTHPDKVFKTKDFSKQMGIARVSFGKPEFMKSLLNTKPGHLSLLSLIFDREKKVKLVIDKSILDFEQWIVHPCDNRESIRLKREDVLEKIFKDLEREYKVVDL